MYFLDTNILIYYLKGLYGVKDSLHKHKLSTYKVPAIVKAELLAGAYKSKKRVDTLEKANDLLQHFEIIPFDDSSTIIFAEIKSTLESRGIIIGPYDLIIASTVIAHKGILLTNNTKEFSRVDNLNIKNIIQD